MGTDHAVPSTDELDAMYESLKNWARSNTIMSMADGVVGRGVLLDVPRAVGIDFFDTGAVVAVADLEATEQAQGVRVGAGDILLVRWGRGPRRTAKNGFDGFSGLHA